MMKQLDTYTYVSALRELVASGQTVSMRIAGNSMAPFLVDTRDSIAFAHRTDRFGAEIWYFISAKPDNMSYTALHALGRRAAISSAMRSSC